MTKNRLFILDFSRGMAVLFMVLYHLTWDLAHFNFQTLLSDFSPGSPLAFIAHMIGSMFLFISGISCNLLSKQSPQLRILMKRIGMIGGPALCISLITFIMFKNQFIYMGILHLLAICSLLAVFVRKLSHYYYILTALLLWMVYYFDLISLPSNHIFFWIGLSDNPPATLDYYPLIPWISVFLLGLAFGKQLNSSARIMKRLQHDEYKQVSGLPSSIAYLGQHALIIYLLHQPIFFIIFSIIVYLS